LIAAFGFIATNENLIVKNILESFMEKSPKELFKVWHFLYQKKYTLDTKEATQRFTNFKENLKIIKTHNASQSTYKLGLNQFSDMDIAEFKAKFATKRPVKIEEREKLKKKLKMIPAAKFLEDEDDDLTKRNLAYASIDLRQYFPAIRDQGQCGSCWAFSTSGALEGAYGVQNKRATSYLSPQQLVDCNTDNSGCDGGDLGVSFSYVQSNGLQSDSSYTYQAVQQNCVFDSTKVAVKPISLVYCSNYDNDPQTQCTIEIVYRILTKGPASIGIDAGNKHFQNYAGGIYTTKCKNDDHAVILVGYGVDSKTGLQYWTVRNSWGASWGDNGYIYVAVDQSNNFSCFVNNEAYLFTF
jgi:C1A family cysteine protease